MAHAFLAHLATKGTTESLPVDSTTWNQSGPQSRAAPNPVENEGQRDELLRILGSLSERLDKMEQKNE